MTRAPCVVADLGRPDGRAFGAWAGPRLVGSVRLRGDGIGTGSGCAELTPGDVSWLVTGARSDENLRLSRRAGYEETGRLLDSAGVELLRLERLARR